MCVLRFKTFSFSLTDSSYIRDVVREMGRDAQYLADMKIEGLTTDWTPCTGKFLVKTT